MKNSTIFLTVGTQLPFDRLVSAVDAWASSNNQLNVVAQIGNSDLEPKHLRWIDYMSASKFKCCFSEADLIVAHAGMGTILTSLDLGKPVVVVPRLAAYGEHRNDHQLATVDQMQRFALVHPVHELTQIGSTLDQLTAQKVEAQPGGSVSTRLLETIHAFLINKQDSPWPLAS